MCFNDLTQNSTVKLFNIVHTFLLILSLQVINDLLDPTGQNLRIREDAQVGLVVSIKIYFVISHSIPLNFTAQKIKLHGIYFTYLL